MTHKMEEVLNYGVMDHTIMENIKMGKSMEEEFITGLMGQSMQEIGSKMKCTEKENSYGQMAENTKDNLHWV